MTLLWDFSHISLSVIQLACIIIQSNQRVGRMVWSRTMGFPNLSFFGKYCRRAFGLSPTEFRKQKGIQEGHPQPAAPERSALEAVHQRCRSVFSQADPGGGEAHGTAANRIAQRGRVPKIVPIFPISFPTQKFSGLGFFMSVPLQSRNESTNDH